MSASQEIDPPPSLQALLTQKRNFRIVQIDAVGVGIAAAAAPFLPVFLTRVQATPIQIGLLTAIPGIMGLLLSIPVGQFLQSRQNVVPWFSLARFLSLSAYALTGIVPFLLPQELIVIAVLGIWAVVTIPQSVVGVSFTVVMNAVAGPERRYELMSRRWSTLGLVSALTAFIAGQVLDRIGFPINYQVVFIGLSLGGLISLYFSSRIQIPDSEPTPKPEKRPTAAQSVRDYIDLIRGHPDFISFSLKRLVFLSGITLGLPLLPLYYVRVVNASDAWIGMLATINTSITLVGYLLWTRLSRRRGSRFVLLATTLGLSFFPVLVGVTRQVELIAVFVGFAGIFGAGINLVFFDELMKTVPVKHSATFVSLAQSMQHFSTILAPLAGTFIAEQFSLQAALFTSAGLRLIGFLLFLRPGRKPAQDLEIEQTAEV